MPFAQDLVDHLEEMVGRKWFGQKRDIKLGSYFPQALIGKGRNQDYLGSRLLLLDVLRQLRSQHPWHVNIENNRIESIRHRFLIAIHAVRSPHRIDTRAV